MRWEALPDFRRWASLIKKRSLLNLYVNLFHYNFGEDGGNVWKVMIPEAFSCLFDLRASDGKDKVLGIYAILRKLRFDLPPVDYTASLELIYEGAAIAFIRGFQSLRVLRLICTNNRRQTLPSWVPDWEGDSQTPYLKEAFNLYHPAAMVQYPSPGKLVVFGNRKDAVLITGSTSVPPLDITSGSDLSQHISQFKALACYLTYVRETLDLTSNLKSYPTQELVPVALHSVLTQGSVPFSDDVFKTWCSVIRYPYQCEYNLEGALQRAKDYELLFQQDANLVYEPWTQEFLTTVTIMFALTRPGEASRHRKPLPYGAELTKLDEAVHAGSVERTFFITQGGYMGTCFKTIQRNDIIALFQSTKEPYVLKSEAESYRVIGPAYIHGFIKMDTPFHVDTKGMEEFVLI